MQDASKEAIYFEETALPGGGQYTVTNNTQDYGLIALGVSNTDTFAWVGSFFDDFDCDFSGSLSLCYDSETVTALNWDAVVIDFAGNTGADIFGDISNVLDPGDDTLNTYLANDGDLQPGQTWDRFLFTQGMPSSQLFVVIDGPGGTIYGSGGAPLPEPGVALLLVTGLAGLAIRRSMSH